MDDDVGMHLHLSPVDSVLFWTAAVLGIAAFLIGITGGHRYREDQAPQDREDGTDA